MHARAGFTLIETLVVMAVAAVLATLAAPAFQSLLLDARMLARAGELVHAVHFARAQALARGVEVMLCPSGDSAQCDETGWSGGFIVTTGPAPGTGARAAGSEPPLLAAAPSAGTTLAANRQAFVFRPAGLRSVNGTFTLCDRRGARHARQVVVSYTGRPRVVAAGQAGRPIECGRPDADSGDRP